MSIEREPTITFENGLKVITFQNGLVCIAQGCVDQAFRNQRIYKALGKNLIVVVGLVSFKGHWLFGGEFNPARGQHHAWLEDEDGNVYDILPIHALFKPSRRTIHVVMYQGKTKEELADGGWDYVRKDALVRKVDVGRFWFCYEGFF